MEMAKDNQQFLYLIAIRNPKYNKGHKITSELRHGMCFMHAITNLNTGIASKGIEKAKSAREDTNFSEKPNKEFEP